MTFEWPVLWAIHIAAALRAFATEFWTKAIAAILGWCPGQSGFGGLPRVGALWTLIPTSIQGQFRRHDIHTHIRTYIIIIAIDIRPVDMERFQSLGRHKLSQLMLFAFPS